MQRNKLIWQLRCSWEHLFQISLLIETTDRGIGSPDVKGWDGSWRGVDILKEPFQVVDGHIALPTKPGLGIEIDENKLANYITDKPWLMT